MGILRVDHLCSEPHTCGKKAVTKAVESCIEIRLSALLALDGIHATINKAGWRNWLARGANNSKAASSTLVLAISFSGFLGVFEGLRDFWDE